MTECQATKASIQIVIIFTVGVNDGTVDRIVNVPLIIMSWVNSPKSLSN